MPGKSRAGVSWGPDLIASPDESRVVDPIPPGWVPWENSGAQQGLSSPPRAVRQPCLSLPIHATKSETVPDL